MKSNTLTTLIFTLAMFFGACSSETPKEYLAGNRGGCYYVGKDGKKVYVDKSKCEEQAARRKVEAEAKAADEDAGHGDEVEKETVAGKKITGGSTITTESHPDLEVVFNYYGPNEEPNVFDKYIEGVNLKAFTPEEKFEAEKRVKILAPFLHQLSSQVYGFAFDVTSDRTLVATVSHPEAVKAMQLREKMFTQPIAQALYGLGFAELEVNLRGVDVQAKKTRYITPKK